MWRRKLIALGLALLWAAGSAMATPGFVQQIGWSSNSNNEATGGNTFKLPLPNATLANNCLCLALHYPDTVTSVTITDNKGNTWPTTPTVSVDDTTNGILFGLFVLPNATAGVNLITVVFNAVVFGLHPAFFEIYNIATASPTDGSAAVFNVTNNSAIASGSFNTTVDGDLILHVAHDTGNGAQGFAGFTDGLSKITKASGYTLLQADLQQGYFCEYQVQGTHGATNPSASITTTTNGGYSSLTLALKSASAGTAPSATAQRVFGILHQKYGSGTGNWKVQFPTTGNLLANLNSDPKSSIEVTAISGSASGGWSVYAPDPGCPTAAYKTSATASSDEVLTVSITDHATHVYIQGVFWDSVNGGAFDTAAFATSSATFGPGNTPNMPAIPPGVSSGIVFSCVGLNTGPPDSLVTPAGYFASVFYTNETDLSAMDNGDCHGAFVFSSNATQNWVYHNTASSSGCNGIALSFGTLAAGSALMPAPIDPQLTPRRPPQIDLTRNVAVAAPAETTLVGQSCL